MVKGLNDWKIIFFTNCSLKNDLSFSFVFAIGETLLNVFFFSFKSFFCALVAQ